MPRIPALLSGAKPPTPMSVAPTSWVGVGSGDPQLITQWRREIDQRQEFESRNPEHAEQRLAVAAHEGVFHRRPLTYKELAARAASTKDATSAAMDAGRERGDASSRAGY